MLAYYQYSPYRDPDGPDPKPADFMIWRDDAETADDADEEVTDFGWLAQS